MTEKIIKILSVIIIFGILSVAIYAIANYSFWKNVYQEIPQEEQQKVILIKDDKNNIEKEVVYKKQELKGEPFTVLLLGIDNQETLIGLADTIILSVISPKEKKITLLSIPRDTKMIMSHNGMADKINHSYNQGSSNTIKTIENYFNIPIDFYASINMQGVIDVVDIIDGLIVEVETDIEFRDRITKSQFILQKGTQRLNGMEVLNYSRYRGGHDGDFGRNRRQQQIISNFIDQSVDVSNVTKINQILNVIEKNFKTNAKISDILKISTIIEQLKNENIEIINFHGRGEYINGTSYVVTDEEHKENITSILHKRLGLLD